MDPYGWIQLALYMLVLLALTKPMGLYLVQVMDGSGKTFLDPVLKPLERLFYRFFRVDPKKEQDWKAIPFPCFCSAWSGCCLPMSFFGFSTCCP